MKHSRDTQRQEGKMRAQGRNGTGQEPRAANVSNIWDRGRRIKTPFASGKLTKKFFMGLREGLYLVSNAGRSPALPCFAGYIVSLEKRERQWQRIRASGAHNMLCRVFGSRKDYDAYIAPILLAYVRKFHKD